MSRYKATCKCGQSFEGDSEGCCYQEYAKWIELHRETCGISAESDGTCDPEREDEE